MQLILYSKSGCHLCEGLQEKLEQLLGGGKFASLHLEVRDIATREDWFCAYQYEVPVLFRVLPQSKDVEEQLPRPSPRATVQQLEQMLQKYFPSDG